MESLARISSLVESARDLTIDAAQAARSSRASTKPLDKGQVKKLLDSRNEREVLDGLRRVVGVRAHARQTTRRPEPSLHVSAPPSHPP
jgi:AP-3 complex subunit beta